MSMRGKVLKSSLNEVDEKGKYDSFLNKIEHRRGGEIKRRGDLLVSLGTGQETR